MDGAGYRRRSEIRSRGSSGGRRSHGDRSRIRRHCMKIVVLDGYCLNPGDLSWDALRELGEVEIFDRTPANEVAARAKGAVIALTNKALLKADTLAQLPELK